MFGLDSTKALTFTMKPAAGGHNRLAKLLVVFCLYLAPAYFIAANAAGSLPPAEQDAAAITVSDAYFRLTPPGRTVSSAYMMFSNNGQQDEVLLSMQSEQAERVELHEHSHSDGMMRMRKVDQLTIAAGESLKLVPGGYHLMLFGLQTGLTQDDIVTIELNFESGKSVIVKANARSLK